MRSLGADEVVDYRKQAFEAMLRDCDAVLGTVRGDPVERESDLSDAMAAIDRSNGRIALRVERRTPHERAHTRDPSCDGAAGPVPGGYSNCTLISPAPMVMPLTLMPRGSSSGRSVRSE